MTEEPRDAAPFAPVRYLRRSQLFCSLSPFARSLARACDNEAFLP